MLELRKSSKNVNSLFPKSLKKRVKWEHKHKEQNNSEVFEIEREALATEVFQASMKQTPKWGALTFIYGETRAVWN